MGAYCPVKSHVRVHLAYGKSAGGVFSPRNGRSWAVPTIPRMSCTGGFHCVQGRRQRLWCKTTGLVSLKFGVSLLKDEQLGEAVFAVAATGVFNGLAKSGAGAEIEQHALPGLSVPPIAFDDLVAEAIPKSKSVCGRS